MSEVNSVLQQQWIYSQIPQAVVGGEHYELRSQQVALELTPGGDQVWVEAHYISVDPYMRIYQSQKPSFNPEPHPLNTVQTASAVGRVLVSGSAHFQAGDWVCAPMGWQTHACLHVSQLQKLDPATAPVTTALGVLGMPGRTAWFGLSEAGRPRPGDVVVVSGAAGAVGSLVVQFARRYGAKVLAIAGGAEKCAWLTDVLHADWTLDYRQYRNAEQLSAAIREKVGGVDVYFDNVGGMISDAVIPLINLRARIVICGQISQYNGGLDEVELGPRFLHHMLYKRATIQGILARDYLHRMDEMLAAVTPWVQAGEIVFQESLIHGFSELPRALQSLFNSEHGGHRGKLLVQIK